MVSKLPRTIAYAGWARQDHVPIQSAVRGSKGRAVPERRLRIGRGVQLVQGVRHTHPNRQTIWKARRPLLISLQISEGMGLGEEVKANAPAWGSGAGARHQTLVLAEATMEPK